MVPPLGAGRSPTDEFFLEKIMRDTVYIIVPTSIEIVNPLNITSLIHRLFMFFILNSCKFTRVGTGGPAPWRGPVPDRRVFFRKNNA